MKVFNGRAATEEYMSTHTLSFSTPEMTLKKFAIWLGEQINDPGGKEQIPRLMLYLENKDQQSSKKDMDLMPDVSDTFKPSGAVTDMFRSSLVSNNKTTPSQLSYPKPKMTESNKAESKTIFCIECGSKINLNSKFCIKCGTKQ